MMFKFISSFYSKLMLAVVVCFILAGGLLLGLAHQSSQQYQNEIEQKLHLQLAEHLVHDSQLFKDGQLDPKAIKQAFHSMMILGPSFEFYILDTSGNVVTYSADPSKIKRKQVALKPIRHFINGDSAMPIIGDDPRSSSRRKIFSVAEIHEGSTVKGYLYIIIGGEIYDSVAELLQGSHIMKLSMLGLLFILGFSLLVVFLIFGLLTKPLRRLAKDIDQFQHVGLEQSSNIAGHWQDNSHDEVQKLGAAFSDMATTIKGQYQKVKDTDQLRRELISYVSHDLRTPLASLQGYLETWQLKHKDLSPEEGEQLIKVALSSARKTSSLVEQLFELAHLDSDSATINEEPVAIAELAQDVIQKLELAAHKKNVSMRVDPQDPSLLACADIQRIERVFTNLLENSIRHCSDGDEIKVLISPAQQSDKLLITVSDTGTGIPADDLPHIFDAHYRAANRAKDKSSHGGLGLAIAKRIVQLHRSSISVESTLGEGTRFSFSLDKPM
ncbi:cell wall metabolism sensor histidine kinase WalK [Agarivorans sp. 1_MG-2023]|uniref:sensor histidine kinase n=1 Tax=Agarivorans sp. 1_MG-2023 TaxID=3062634 RepID=UPI0026E2BF22|nr:HAMP domain-containing sensor histidine kinase [Agarivorans sp. 1_MG-2023]MDO6765663.1 HAMP domain-containing sensor histidine kinase [Agarivorans sp. 1_MG-2023]